MLPRARLESNPTNHGGPSVCEIVVCAERGNPCLMGWMGRRFARLVAGRNQFLGLPSKEQAEKPLPYGDPLSFTSAGLNVRNW